MSTERELVDKFKEAFEARNIDLIDPYLAEEMSYELLPSSVGRKMTKTEWKDNASQLFGAAHSFKLEPTKIVEHPLFVVVQTDIILGFPGAQFVQGILLLFNFSKDESGVLKIASVTEYVDSFKMKEWKAKMASGAPPSE